MIQQSTSEQREQRKDMHAMQQSIQTLAVTVASTLSHIQQHPVSHLSAPTRALDARPGYLPPNPPTTSVPPSRIIHINPTAQHVPSKPPPAMPSAPLATTTQSTSPPADPLPLMSHSLIIGHRHIHYDPDKLVAPPRHNYSANPELLVDDWEHLQVVLCPGQCEDIGVKYWKQLYKGTVHWTRLRRYYSIWAVRMPFAGSAAASSNAYIDLSQFVAAEFSRYPSREQFWAKFSNNGKRFTWSEITQHLKRERADRDHAQAQAARLKYGDLALHRDFKYTRSNIRKDMTSDQAIARVYHKLEGLEAVCLTK